MVLVSLEEFLSKEEPPEHEETKPEMKKRKNKLFYHLIQGDCKKVLPYFDVWEFDVIITDPPYGLEIAKNGRIGGDNIGKAKNYGSIKWDSRRGLTKNIFHEFRRVSRNQVIFGGNYFTDVLPVSSCWLVWDKRKGTTPDNFADGELIWTSFNGQIRIFSHLWRGMFRDSERGERYHPTQKPVKLMEWIIQMFTQEGDVVLDPFIGSGSTMVACQNLKRSCVGIEIEPKYCEIVKKRCFGRQFLDREVEYKFRIWKD